jgi:ComF family protein
VYEYGGIVAEVVKKSKYKPKTFALLRLLSFSGAKMASKLGFDFTGFTVVPVPISKARAQDRGFNQAEIIARAAGKEFSLVVNTSILARMRDTTKQFGLHKAERTHNITGAFAVKGEVAGGKFLLVDDICTTGSTLMACASALFAAGACDVKCFTLSRKI